MLPHCYLAIPVYTSYCVPYIIPRHDFSFSDFLSGTLPLLPCYQHYLITTSVTACVLPIPALPHITSVTTSVISTAQQATQWHFPAYQSGSGNTYVSGPLTSELHDKTLFFTAAASQFWNSVYSPCSTYINICGVYVCMSIMAQNWY